VIKPGRVAGPPHPAIINPPAAGWQGLRACGYSWAEISSRLGITRQAA
jgi:hypothetical protein